MMVPRTPVGWFFAGVVLAVVLNAVTNWPSGQNGGRRA